jgi:hypothetical protein
MVRYEELVACCAGLLESARSAERFDPRPAAAAISGCVGLDTELAARALSPYPDNAPVTGPFAHLPHHVANVAALCVQALYRAGRTEGIMALAEAALVHDLGMTHRDVIGVLADRRKREPNKAAIERHPDLGRECWKRGRVSPAARDIAFYHHRWPDGGGYPKGDIPRRARPDVFVLRLFDSVEAGSHARSYKGMPDESCSTPLPWAVFDSEIETRDDRSDDWDWALNAARRCLYGVVCDRVRQEQFEPDLNRPFFEKYLTDMLGSYIGSQFPRLHREDIEDCIGESRVRFLVMARKKDTERGALREQGAAKKLLKQFAYEHALRIVGRPTPRPFPDAGVGGRPDPAPRVEIEDEIGKIVARMSLEEMCVYVRL